MKVTLEVPFSDPKHYGRQSKYALLPPSEFIYWTGSIVFTVTVSILLIIVTLFIFYCFLRYMSLSLIRSCLRFRFTGLLYKKIAPLFIYSWVDYLRFLYCIRRNCHYQVSVRDDTPIPTPFKPLSYFGLLGQFNGGVPRN